MAGRNVARKTFGGGVWISGVSIDFWGIFYALLGFTTGMLSIQGLISETPLNTLMMGGIPSILVVLVS